MQQIPHYQQYIAFADCPARPVRPVERIQDSHVRIGMSVHRKRVTSARGFPTPGITFNARFSP
jgi:hypothetical protein